MLLGLSTSNPAKGTYGNFPAGMSPTDLFFSGVKKKKKNRQNPKPTTEYNGKMKCYGPLSNMKELYLIITFGNFSF